VTGSREYFNPNYVAHSADDEGLFGYYSMYFVFLGIVSFLLLNSFI
jgi:hypothetical protein